MTRGTGGTGGTIDVLVGRFTPRPTPAPASPPPRSPLPALPDRTTAWLLRAAERYLTDLLADPHWCSAWHARYASGDTDRGRENALRPLWVYLDVAQAQAEAGDLQGVLRSCLDLCEATDRRRWEPSAPRPGRG